MPMKVSQSPLVMYEGGRGTLRGRYKNEAQRDSWRRNPARARSTVTRYRIENVMEGVREEHEGGSLVEVGSVYEKEKCGEEGW